MLNFEEKNSEMNARKRENQDCRCHRWTRRWCYRHIVAALWGWIHSIWFDGIGLPWITDVLCTITLLLLVEDIFLIGYISSSNISKEIQIIYFNVSLDNIWSFIHCDIYRCFQFPFRFLNFIVFHSPIMLSMLPLQLLSNSIFEFQRFPLFHHGCETFETLPA